jgi:copper chaperone
MKLNVEGMTCSHCQRSITRAVAAVGGTARVDLTAGTVEVEGTDDLPAVRAAIEAEGYTVTSGAAPSPAEAAGCCGSCHA